MLLIINKDIFFQQHEFTQEQQGTAIWYIQPWRAPCSPLKQRRESFFTREIGSWEGLLQSFSLLCFVTGAGHESSPYWPPCFTSNEVSIY